MTVYLVGAGPGDPGLLTRRGASLLAHANVVVFDRLVDRSVLELAHPAAELVDVGKSPGGGEITQPEINELLVELAGTHGVVVRLKGGDPYVFGRGGEEGEALERAGVPYEVVPGVSALSAVPGAAGVPLTMRGRSSAIVVVTGHELEDRDGAPALDWAALARSRATIVVMMGVARRGEIAERLLAAGRPASTPVLAVIDGTTPEQRSLRTTLGGLAGAPIDHPATIVIGEVAAMHLASIEDRPLFGWRVVVTRAAEDAPGLAQLLSQAGARPVPVPSIVITGPADGGAALAGAASRLSSFDWVAFSSPHGVDRLAAAVRDARDFAGPRLAAIGRVTVAALQAHGLLADLVADRAIAEGLLEVFPRPDHSGARVLLPRPAIGRDVLPTGLRQLGYDVEEVEAYRTERAVLEPAMLADAEGADAVLFTSSSTVEGFLAALGNRRIPPIVASIGPATTATLRAEGLVVDIEADRHDTAGLVEALAVFAHQHHVHRDGGDEPGTLAVMEADPSSTAASYPARRMRRLRATPALRRMVAETRVGVDDLLAPLFVADGIDEPVPIASLPGVVRHSVASLVREGKRLVALGVPGVVLFGVSTRKDAVGSEASAPDGIVQRALAELRVAVGGELVLIADLCLDEYTDHGHCGVLDANGRVDNDATLSRYAEVAHAQAEAGADVVAPSGMMDGQVGAIRTALDGSGHQEVAILAYAAKFASALYAPFRDAVDVSIRGSGDRRSYQLDPANGREALAEVRLDLAEGADLVMVKPALPYLDVVATVRARVEVPVAAYHVSGEYAMLAAAAAAGVIDRQAVALESLLAIKRAGADVILTYLAAEVAELLDRI